MWKMKGNTRPTSSCYIKALNRAIPLLKESPLSMSRKRYAEGACKRRNAGVITARCLRADGGSESANPGQQTLVGESPWLRQVSAFGAFADELGQQEQLDADVVGVLVVLVRYLETGGRELALHRECRLAKPARSVFGAMERFPRRDRRPRRADEQPRVLYRHPLDEVVFAFSITGELCEAEALTDSALNPRVAEISKDRPELWIEPMAFRLAHRRQDRRPA